MRVLAYAASALVVLCSVITVHAAPTDSVTAAFTNQTVTDMAPRDAPAQPTCTRNGKGGPLVGRYKYEVTIPTIPFTRDPPNVCHHLWKELKKYPLCLVTKPNSCYEGDNRSLKWSFMAPRACRSGMVRTAFYAATKNQFGALPEKCKSDRGS